MAAFRHCIERGLRLDLFTARLPLSPGYALRWMAVRNIKGYRALHPQHRESTSAPRFEPELAGFHGDTGIGVISDRPHRLMGSPSRHLRHLTVSKNQQHRDPGAAGVSTAALLLGHHGRRITHRSDGDPHLRAENFETGIRNAQQAVEGPARCWC